MYIDQRLGAAARQTLVEIVIFNVFAPKNIKKQEICSKFLAKKQFFLSLHQNAGRLFYSKKWLKYTTTIAMNLILIMNWV